jgi:hypothetical protein
MTRRWLSTVLAVLGALEVLPAPAFAHHGMATYDFQRQVTLKATVTKFTFVNPHVLLYVAVKDGNGKVVEWVAEAGSPNMMRRGGWNRSSVKPGEQITITGHPAKNGSPTMRFIKVILPNGQELDPAAGFD